MNTTEALATLDAAGIRLAVRDGILTAGPRGAMTTDLQELIRAHRDALLAELSRPRRSWLVRHPDGWASHTFNPEASREQIAAWYPEALDIQPEHEPRDGQEKDR